MKTGESKFGVVRSDTGSLGSLHQVEAYGWVLKKERQHSWPSLMLLPWPLWTPARVFVCFSWWGRTVTFLAFYLLILFLNNQKPCRGQGVGDSWCIWGAKTEWKIWDWAGRYVLGQLSFSWTILFRNWATFGHSTESQWYFFLFIPHPLPHNAKDRCCIAELNPQSFCLSSCLVVDQIYKSWFCFEAV